MLQYLKQEYDLMPPSKQYVETKMHYLEHEAVLPFYLQYYEHNVKQLQHMYETTMRERHINVIYLFTIYFLDGNKIDTSIGIKINSIE